MRAPPVRTSRSHPAAIKRGASSSATPITAKKRKVQHAEPSPARAKNQTTAAEGPRRKTVNKKPPASKKTESACAKKQKTGVSTKKSQGKKRSNTVSQKPVKGQPTKTTTKKVVVKPAKKVSDRRKPTISVTVTKTQYSSRKETVNNDAVVSEEIPTVSGEHKAEYKKVQSKKLDLKNKKQPIKGTKKVKGSQTPAPLTRKKKLQQQQTQRNRTTVIKRIPKSVLTGNRVKKEETNPKKIATRKKSSTPGSKEVVSSSSGGINKGCGSAIRWDKNESKVELHLDGTCNVTDVTMVKSTAKGGRKAKVDGCAIKKSEKKQFIRKKPKKDLLESKLGKGSDGNAGNVSANETKDGMGSKKRNDKSKVIKCVKKIKPNPKDCNPALKNSTAKSVLSKPVKVVSSKVKKLREILPAPSETFLKKRLTAGGKKSKMQQISQKVTATAGVSNNDEDSTTSDEITLDRLLMREQHSKQHISSLEHGSADIYGHAPGCIDYKPTLPLNMVAAVKVESISSSPVSSPTLFLPSDNDNLKHGKGRIKVKLEQGTADADKTSSAVLVKKVPKKETAISKSTFKPAGKDPAKVRHITRMKEVDERTYPVKSENLSLPTNKKEPHKREGPKKVVKVKKPTASAKKTRTDGGKNGGSGSDSEQRARRMKLFGFWSGPKRHRVASLNALAKVHCLYENESRGALMGFCRTTANTSGGRIKTLKQLEKRVKENTSEVAVSTRTLRSAPGMRGMGKHWDMHNASSTSSSSPSSSSDENGNNSDSASAIPVQSTSSVKQKRGQKMSAASKGVNKKLKQQIKKVVRRRRKRSELMMDLKDMVVRKRMASLNASAILAASYSVEKRQARPLKEDVSIAGDVDGAGNTVLKKKHRKRVSSKKIVEEDDSDVEVEECDIDGGRSVIELRTTPGGQKNKQVAVILNQDTDVTITGVYVNSTTRSTHHEGYCSIAGMQYRISSTSHTQTEATAVATETVLHTSTAAEHPPAHHAPEPPLAPPIKSYTPLGALSNMQPPGAPTHHHHAHPRPPLSPLGRRHGCSSAFSAPPPPPPPNYVPPPPPPAQHHGYYQPAGPLILSNNAGKIPPVLPTIEATATPTPPPSTVSHTGAPASTPSGATTRDESSDNDVIITATSCSAGGDVVPPAPQPLMQQQQPIHAGPYRYQTYPPPAPSTPQHLHHSYNYNYPHTQYYPSPPASASIQYPANPPAHHTHYHNQELCYPSTNYPPASYFHHKSYSTPPPPASYHRRYIAPPPPQYYPPDLYSGPGTGNSSQQTNQGSQQSQQMVVTASSGSTSNYQAPPAPLVESYPPPPPVPLVDPYPPPPAYYTGYSGAPGPGPCYSHSPPSRSLAFIDATYQSCPCPMQSCPKNVHTGPLTGDGKGPHLPAKQQETFHHLPLPPVALALPLEPPGALGPPSPARGSAGMPPPPSPATASARNPTQNEDTPTYQQCNSWDATVQCSKPHTKSNKQEPSQQDYVGVTQVVLSPDNTQIAPTKMNINPAEGTALQDSEVKSKLDPVVHRLLTISKTSNSPVSESKSKKRRSTIDSVSVSSSVCEDKCPKRPAVEISKVDSSKSAKCVSHNAAPVKLEDVSVVNNQSEHAEKHSVRIRMGYRHKKRPADTLIKQDTVPARKRRKVTAVTTVDEGSGSQQELAKVHRVTEVQQDNSPNHKCKTNQSFHPLSSNSSTLHNSKQNTKRRKKDVRESTENKEPLCLPSKKSSNSKLANVTKLNTKTYPSRVKKTKKRDCCDKVCGANGYNVTLNRSRSIVDALTGAKQSIANGSVTPKKTLGSKNLCKKREKKLISSLLENKKSPLKPNHLVVPFQSAPVVPFLGRVQRKKRVVSLDETSAKVNHRLRRCSLRDTIVDQVLEDTDEPNKSGKVCVQLAVPALVPRRRSSTGSKKDTKLSTKKSSEVKASNCELLQFAKKQLFNGQEQLISAVCKKVSLKKSLSLPKWSNGWSWEGKPFQAKVFLTSDGVPLWRRCYSAMRHTEGDVIYPRDCVLLKSGPRKVDLPYIAKIAALWENPDDGEMMISLLWYYRPEHTDQCRQTDIMEDEIFASKHKDITSVACIEDRCYVLTFNEYCRYRKNVRRLEEAALEPPLVVPSYAGYPRKYRQPPGCVSPDLVFFCRRVYDFRQRRILKNPC